MGLLFSFISLVFVSKESWGEQRFSEALSYDCIKKGVTKLLFLCCISVLFKEHPIVE